MNFQFYLEKIKASEEYKNFIKENPDAFLCSGFFVVDKNGKDNKTHFDYWANGKMFSFQLEGGIQLVPIETINNTLSPEKISEKIDFNLEEVERMITEKIEEEMIKNKVQKILLSLQSKNQKSFLIGTVFLSMLGILKVNIDISKGKIVLFEKKSMFDIVRRVK